MNDQTLPPREQYPVFVSFAVLQARSQLDSLLAKWKVEPTPGILEDAARFGCQMAREKFLPGATDLPFERDPLGEILRSLRAAYEDGIDGDPGEDPAESSEFVLLADDDGEEASFGPKAGEESSHNSKGQKVGAGAPLKTTLKKVPRASGFPFSAKRKPS